MTEVLRAKSYEDQQRNNLGGLSPIQGDNKGQHTSKNLSSWRNDSSIKGSRNNLKSSRIAFIWLVIDYKSVERNTQNWIPAKVKLNEFIWGQKRILRT